MGWFGSFLKIQEREQAEGTPRWWRQEEKRLSEKIQIRGRKLLKSCGLSHSWTSWQALCLFGTRSSLQRKDIFVKTFQPKLKYCVLTFILALTRPRFLLDKHLLALFNRS